MTPESQFQETAWRKSSYSQGATQCVEVAAVGDSAGIRDSKDPSGAVLLLQGPSMRDLVHRIKTGHISF